MLHPLPLPLSSCLGCIPPLIGLPSLRFYAVGSSLFLLSVCFCLCSLFYRDDVLCWLLLARPFLYAFHAHLRFPVDLVWFRLSCDHGWIRSGSVNVRKQQQQQLNCLYVTIILLRNLTKGSFSVDLENTSNEIYHEENGSLRIVTCFWLSKPVESSVILTLCPFALLVRCTCRMGLFSSEFHV